MLQGRDREDAAEAACSDAALTLLFARPGAQRPEEVFGVRARSRDVVEGFGGRCRAAPGRRGQSSSGAHHAKGLRAGGRGHRVEPAVSLGELAQPRGEVGLRQPYAVVIGRMAARRLSMKPASLLRRDGIVVEPVEMIRRAATGSRSGSIPSTYQRPRASANRPLLAKQEDQTAACLVAMRTL